MKTELRGTKRQNHKSNFQCPTRGITNNLGVVKTVTQLKQAHTHLLTLLTKPQRCSILPRFLAKLLLYLPGDNLSYARHLFDQIPSWNRTPFLWTCFIRNHVQNSHFAESIVLYSDMHREGVPATEFTFSSVLNACARIPENVAGKQVHKVLVQSGFLGNKVVVTALLGVYAKCGFVADARSVFDSLDGDRKDVVAYTAMICGYAKMGMMSEARRLFDAVGKGNVVSWTTMVAGYTNLGDMKAARQLYDLMLEKNSVTWVAMIAGYGKCGNLGEARRMFDGIVGQKDASCWAAMIACYAQNGCAEEAIDMYKDMRKRAEKISVVAMVGVISACTQLGDFELGKILVEDMENGICERTSVVSNALIHMYAKHGCLDRAWGEFNRTLERDVISYNSMITALADHGMYLEALNLFLKMQDEGIKPNAITFVGVLNACSHGGFVEQGCKHFKLMTQKFCIHPSSEHLTCMVDILGRAGQLERAYTIILEYKAIASSPGIWGALLGASKLHGNTEMGEIAASSLSELEFCDAGNYLLLANAYASKGKWDDVQKARSMASRRGVSKSPGSSWISGQ